MLRELSLDDQLIREAKDIGRHKTDAEAVTAALREYIIRRRQQQIVALFGTIDYDPGSSEVNQLNRIKLMMATAYKNMEADETDDDAETPSAGAASCRGSSAEKTASRPADEAAAAAIIR